MGGKEGKLSLIMIMLVEGARGVLTVDYTEQVQELGDEPDTLRIREMPRRAKRKKNCRSTLFRKSGQSEL